MKAGLRWKVPFAVGLLVAAAPALGQAAPEPSGNTPATDGIGPREIQNFSLPGTTTKPAEQPPPAKAAPGTVPGATVRIQPRPEAPVATARQRALEPAREGARAKIAMPPAAAQTGEAPPPSPKAQAAELPPPVALTSTPPPSFNSVPVSPTPTAESPQPGRGFPILPWIIAALVLAGAGIFLLWRRNRGRDVLAGGREHDLFIPPEPAPAPRSAAPVLQPVPQPASIPIPSAAPIPARPPRSSGIVASRLRPSIELAMQPLRCLVDDEQVTIEFEVELFNSGTAPARAVIAEASLFNASSSQEQELAAFYAKPPAVGDRIDSIPPMRRMTFTNRVTAPRAQVQEYELAGRKSFVPVIAFNAQYEWSGGKGQSSLAYLLGRETRGDKLGPLHLDGARRELRGLGARVLPTAVRT